MRVGDLFRPVETVVEGVRLGTVRSGLDIRYRTRAPAGGARGRSRDRAGKYRLPRADLSRRRHPKRSDAVATLPLSSAVLAEDLDLEVT